MNARVRLLVMAQGGENLAKQFERSEPQHLPEFANGVVIVSPT